MRRLMLLRHAKTENDAPTGRDQDRRLDERGRNDAAEIGGWIAGQAHFPDSVLVSIAVRTRQTWEIAWNAMQDVVPPPQVEFVAELYGAEPSHLLRIIHSASASDPKQILIIGHNPGMHELALTLTDGAGDEAARRAIASNLPTSGLAIFEFATDDWADVAFRSGRLVQFVSPKLLKPQDD